VILCSELIFGAKLKLILTFKSLFYIDSKLKKVFFSWLISIDFTSFQLAIGLLTSDLDSMEANWAKSKKTTLDVSLK